MNGTLHDLSVAEGYERWAPTYDHAPNPLLAREERYLLPLLAGLRKKRILDLGCGTGRWLHKLVPNIQSGVGVDRSGGMLRVARTKCTIAGRLARAKCESLPFHAGVFDLVVCSFTLGHVHDLGLLVRELARVTKSGADLFITDLHPDAYRQGWRVGFRDEHTAAHITVLPRTATEIIEPFYGSGFRCLEQVPLWLGQQEQPIFARAGKSDSFVRACQVPAILALHLRHLNPAIEIRRA